MSYRQICINSYYRHHDMACLAEVVVEKDGEYFYIEDEMEKIDKVNAMPDFIKDDWFLYNKKELTLEKVDQLILTYQGEHFEDVALTLKLIKRDLLIKRII